MYPKKCTSLNDVICAKENFAIPIFFATELHR